MVTQKQNKVIFRRQSFSDAAVSSLDSNFNLISVTAIRPLHCYLHTFRIQEDLNQFHLAQTSINTHPKSQSSSIIYKTTSTNSTHFNWSLDTQHSDEIQAGWLWFDSWKGQEFSLLYSVQTGSGAQRVRQSCHEAEWQNHTKALSE